MPSAGIDAGIDAGLRVRNAGIAAGIVSAGWSEPYAAAAQPARDFATCAAMSHAALSSVISKMIPCEMTQ